MQPRPASFLACSVLCLSFLASGCFLFPPKAVVSPCLTNNGGCSLNATCSVNALNVATCACNGGYIGNGTSCTAEVTGPCATNNGGCDQHANCSDTGGTVTCTCDSGYVGNGMTCTATNPSDGGNNTGPCSTGSNPCGAHSQCADDNGNAVCTCDSGYTSPNGNGTNCEPNTSNPCSPNPCGSNSMCTVNGSSFTCTCDSGYTSPNGNGENCVLSSSGGSVGAACTTAGSQSTCNTGETCLATNDTAGDNFCTIANCTADSACGTTNGIQNRCEGTSGSSLCLEGCTSTTSNTCPTGFGCSDEFDYSGSLTHYCDLDCVTGGGCGYGETCNTVTHGCNFVSCTGTGQGTCPSGDICTPGSATTNICVPNCNSTACPSGATCDTTSGVCEYNVVGNYGVCQVQANCPAGYDCIMFPSAANGVCLATCTSSGATCAAGPTGLAEACNIQVGSAATDLVCSSPCTSGSTTCPTGSTCQVLGTTTYFCLPPQ